MGETPILTFTESENERLIIARRLKDAEEEVKRLTKINTELISIISTYFNYDFEKVNTRFP